MSVVRDTAVCSRLVTGKKSQHVNNFMDGLHVSLSQKKNTSVPTKIICVLSENSKTSPIQALGVGTQGTVTIAIPARGILIHIYRGLQDASGLQDRSSQGHAHWQVKKIHAFCLVQSFFLWGVSRPNFRQDWNHESEVLGVQPRALTMLWLRYKNTKRMVSPVDPETI